MSEFVDLLKILDTVDSTNNYAMGKLREGTWKHGNACFSFYQTHGKGTRAKHWESNKGENIILSIVADTSFLFIKDQFCLSAACALSCYDLLSTYAGNFKIKWPNDIYWNDRKAGGILIENVIRGNKWQWAVIGIGININQLRFNEENISPVSLKEITGENYDVIQLAEELYVHFFKRYELLKKNRIDTIMFEYNHNLYLLNKKTRLKRKVK